MPASNPGQNDDTIRMLATELGRVFTNTNLRVIANLREKETLILGLTETEYWGEMT